jgi:hypothetical protein
MRMAREGDSDLDWTVWPLRRKLKLTSSRAQASQLEISANKSYILVHSNQLKIKK